MRVAVTVLGHPQTVCTHESIMGCDHPWIGPQSQVPQPITVEPTTAHSPHSTYYAQTGYFESTRPPHSIFALLRTRTLGICPPTSASLAVQCQPWMQHVPDDGVLILWWTLFKMLAENTVGMIRLINYRGIECLLMALVAEVDNVWCKFSKFG